MRLIMCERQDLEEPEVTIAYREMTESVKRVSDYVMYVDQDSVAWAQGLRRGDTIVSIDGEEVKSMEELNLILAKHEAGDELNIIVYRDHKLYNGRLTLQEAGR